MGPYWSLYVAIMGSERRKSKQKQQQDKQLLSFVKLRALWRLRVTLFDIAMYHQRDICPWDISIIDHSPTEIKKTGFKAPKDQLRRQMSNKHHKMLSK